jgi:hypothetical protein
LHAGEKRQERVGAHRDDRLMVESDERSALMRGQPEAFGIGRAVGEIFRATLRLVGNPEIGSPLCGTPSGIVGAPTFCSSVEVWEQATHEIGTSLLI